MAKNELIADIFDKKRRTIGRIALNGYNIRAGGPLGKHGAMRSFRVIQGADKLYDHWNIQQTFVIESEDGRTSEVRIAAYPAEEGGFGFVEFI